MTDVYRRPAKLEPWQDPKELPYVQIEGVSKKFGDFAAVDDVSLSIYRGEFFALLGGSGCGKTTLLRLLAGFEQPSAGRIMIDGLDVAGIPPYDRPVNMMFQSYALFPHMTVAQNIAFGLHQDRLPRETIRERVAEVLELVQLARHGHRRPHQLSGGQRQRVALARSLVKRPKLLLLDEPLAALDKKLREQTQFELVNIQEQVGVTFIIVTHDQEEAMTMASRIAVMDHGYIVQTGTPSEIYEFPSSRFVAEFIGSVNIFDGLIVESAPDHAMITSEDAGCDLFIGQGVSAAAGTPVGVAVRPEKMQLSKVVPDQGDADQDLNPPSVTNRAHGVVVEIAYVGTHSLYVVRLDSGKPIRVLAPNLTRTTEMPITWDDHVHVAWGPTAGVVLTQ